MASSTPLGVGVVLFDRFELLDVFGPLEVLGCLPDAFALCLVGPDAAPVRSAQGPRVVVDHARSAAPACDVVLVPGGIGTRVAVEDEALLGWLARFASSASIVASVCTGSGLLAAAGLLDSRRATSNKRAFAWARRQGPRVDWVAEARWVADGDRWTSSGVAAGIDMTLALVGHLLGEAVADEVADRIEHDRHRDAGWDPFAAKNGLV